jgi:hypothetical protein
MSEDYNVFISWSGKRSLSVAQKLREWLPTVVQAARPWMSDTDIEKGTRGLNEIAKALTGIKVGIVCLTSENLNEPWLLFEAGALSKTITDDKTRLCTYLLGDLNSHEIKQPLGMFQHTTAKKDETRKLVHTINKAVSDPPVMLEHLDKAFDALWPELNDTIKAIPATASGDVAPKRNLDDMVGEILDLVRAEANARTIPQPFSFILSNPSVPLSLQAPQSAYPKILSSLPPYEVQGFVNLEGAKALGGGKKSATETSDKGKQKNKAGE